jgi:gallate decarboxylase subunit C
MAKAAKKQRAPAEEINDLRHALEWLKAEGDLVETDQEVDPDLEITAIQKNLDGGCPILFNNVKGKPNHRCVTNLFGDMNVINKMFGWANHTDRTKKLADAIKNQILPVEVSSKEAPVHEEVIKDPKEVNDYVVPIRHTG